VAVVALADDAPDAGALSDTGKTIDPLTVAAKPADQIWAAKAPPKGTPVRACPCRIVSYADDMARHDCGDYCKPRDYIFAEEVDVDGDRDASDDYVASLPFSLTETLSMPNWPAGPRLPERSSATVHGGRSWWIANSSRENYRRKFCVEIGINPNHSPPFRDGRAEDHPLQGNPDEASPTSFLFSYITKVWKKADFLNGGDKHRVTFDKSSRLASLCTRGYWYGYDEVRMVVLDLDQWYISDMDQFDIPKDMKEYRGGRCFICYPTKATWAKWTPEGYKNNFDAEKATFAKYEFKDVRAVGWHLAKVNRECSNSHLKWYGFEVDAVVHRPEQPSVNLAMAEIRADDIPAFYITTCEIPYAFWKKVFRYGDAPINTLDARYTFALSGDMGSMRLGSKEHVQNEPVTNLTLYDMLAAANCLSQMEGKTPVYYLDPEFKTHFRNMHIALCSDGPDLTTGHDVDVGGKKPIRMHCNSKIKEFPLPKIYVKWDADGHRLPTTAEWQAAAGNVPAAPATDGTQPVGQGKPNAHGLYDVAGNVRELVWTYGDVFDPETHDTQTTMGGDFHGPGDPLSAERAASPYGDVPFDGHHSIGLRLVCRKAGLAPPPADSAPGGTVFKKGQETRARKAAEPIREPVLEMVDIPDGEFTPRDGRGQDGSPALSMSPIKMGKHEVTFAQWEAVRHWGEANGYVFSRHGHVGSMYWYHFPHTPDEPVTFMAWHDAAVWCNALSEMEGRTPFYYTDREKTKVYRKAFPYRPVKYAGWDLVGEHGQHSGKELHDAAGEPWLHQKWDGDGYRLPTRNEYLYALQGGTGDRFYWGKKGKTDDHAWSIHNAGGRTHPVAQKKPNPFGLYDMIGNVYEWSNSCSGKGCPRDRRYDTNNPKLSRYWPFGLGKKYQYVGVQNPERIGGSWFFGGVHRVFYFHDTSNEYMPDFGFRVVRCEAGTHPPDGSFPIVIPTLLEFDEKDYDDLAGAAFRGSLRRDGVYQTAGVAQLKGVKWRTDLGGPIKSSPVVTGGVVYLGGPKGFHALDAASGAQKWNIPIKEGGVVSSACIAKGAVYFAAMDGRVYAADAKSGQVKWRTLPKGNRGDPLMGSPAVAYDTVFVSAANNVVGFNTETGAEFYHGIGAKKGRRALTLEGRYFYSGSTIRVDNATVLFSPVYMTHWCADGSETVCLVGDLYYGASSGRGGYSFARLGCTDTVARQTKWSIFVEGHLPEKERNYTTIPPTVWDGKVFIATDNGVMYAFDAMQGKKLDWEFNAGKNNGLHSPPSVAAGSGLIYFGSQSGELFAVDARIAKEKWRTELGGAIETSPWPGDGVVYVSCDDGFLYALEGARKQATQ
jgi:outer membrane protein assembly factor BamB/formylglycine-generating enzyme required for sulfatase activity